MTGLTTYIKGVISFFEKNNRCFDSKVKKVCSLPVISPLNPYAFPAKLTLIPRSVETSGRELRRISETSGKVIFSYLNLIRYIVISNFYSKRSRWGEIPRFTGKSPPRIFIFSECSDSPCN